MAWYDEAIFYHIYPIGLTGAPRQNPYGETVHRLRGLWPWVDHIRELGCTALYIGPLFESVGHGYETTDYRRLDSRLGDNEDLKAFVEKCRESGIRVVLDGVFNHTGRDFFAFRDLRTYRENSRYRDWYCNVNFRSNNEYNDGFSYDNWGGYNLLVKLNLHNPEVREYLFDTVRFWISEFNIDGLRLDAADVLDFDFMKSLRSVCTACKQDFWLMGEVIHGEYNRWVNEGTLHSVTNYALHKALFSGHNDHNYFEIAHTVNRLNNMGINRPDGLKLYNFVDNHDVERIFSKLRHKEDFLPVHILLYTLPGLPSIYYGSEYGIEGSKEWGSDDALRPQLNLDDLRRWDNSQVRLITRLGHIRRENPVLSYGNYKERMLTTGQYVFTREDPYWFAVIGVNNSDSPAQIQASGLWDGPYRAALSGGTLRVSGGSLRAELPAHSGEIWLWQRG